MPEFCFVVQKRYKKMMYKAYKWLILTVEQQKRRPVKSAISIDYNQFNSLIIRWLLADAAYYANWLSIVYSLKDRLLENLLVFSSKIEDLTLLTLVYLQTKGKRENGSILLLNLRFAKIRHICDYFADYGCKIVNEFTDFLAYNWVAFDFGRAISFLPSKINITHIQLIIRYISRYK